MMQTIYQIWMARNDARDGKRIEEPKGIAEKVKFYSQEWEDANPSGREPRTNPPREKWRAPKDGWVMANVDGSLSKLRDKGGGGAIFRDHHGRFLAGTCHFFPVASEPELVELLACRRAVNLAIEMGISKLTLESDCKEMVSKISSTEKDLSVHGPIVEEIKLLLRSLNEVAIRWVRRSANGAAHRLAKEGCQLGLCKTWFTEPLVCVRDVLIRDLSDAFE